MYAVENYEYVYAITIRFSQKTVNYQTSPGNGKYYDYTEIEKAWVSSGIHQNGAQNEYCNIALPNDSVIRFLFYYADTKGVEYLVKRVDGKTQKFQFEKPIYEH